MKIHLKIDFQSRWLFVIVIAFLFSVVAITGIDVVRNYRVTMAMATPKTKAAAS